ncbi:hypothetical protein TOPH_02730 [Tolypocladium ophioglossoides CBS 100239]|uniref:Uncharacterized protein n=1 Tax=Tolypocladium ophioglossoides (strain CBS 100239) TaxID=1163406 RepID=A0A0L0NEL6_TOLOC|nr:hypothetical protein TOPH_02730 [Tolypocladium ophioglossoides CBS 100239]
MKWIRKISALTRKHMDVFRLGLAGEAWHDVSNSLRRPRRLGPPFGLVPWKQHHHQRHSSNLVAVSLRLAPCSPSVPAGPADADSAVYGGWAIRLQESPQV